jgi:hypothetical protein
MISRLLLHSLETTTGVALYECLDCPRVNLSTLHPMLAMIAAAAKHDPEYRITFSNLPPPTSNPNLSCRCSPVWGEERAVEIGVDRILPRPRDRFK